MFFKKYLNKKFYINKNSNNFRIKYVKKKINFNFIDIGKKVIEIEKKNLSFLYKNINNNFNLAIKEILLCTGKVIVTGIGKSGYIGRKISSTLSSTGTPSLFLNPSEACHGDLGVIQYTDIILAISNSGESSEIINLFPTLKIFKVPIISITGNKKSSISLASKVNLSYKILKEACPFGLSPTSSSTIALVIGDALAITLLKYRKFTKKKFSLLHPGGEIGKKFVYVKDIMHNINNIPFFYKNSSIYEVIIEIFKKNFNIAIVYNNSMKIEGILTDYELRKIINKNLNIKDYTISDVLNLKNFYVYYKSSIIEALNLMKTYKTNVLFVKKKSKYIGIIHINDIFYFCKK